MLDFDLGAGAAHRPKLRRLAQLDTAAADDLIHKQFLAPSLPPSLPSFRVRSDVLSANSSRRSFLESAYLAGIAGTPRAVPTARTVINSDQTVAL